MTRKIPITSRPVLAPDRSANPVTLFVHSAAMMGNERWDEAITALHRYLELIHNPADRLIAYQNPWVPVTWLWIASMKPWLR